MLPTTSTVRVWVDSTADNVDISPSTAGESVELQPLRTDRCAPVCVESVMVRLQYVATAVCQSGLCQQYYL